MHIFLYLQQKHRKDSPKTNNMETTMNRNWGENKISQYVPFYTVLIFEPHKCINFRKTTK